MLDLSSYTEEDFDEVRELAQKLFNNSQFKSNQLEEKDKEIERLNIFFFTIMRKVKELRLTSFDLVSAPKGKVISTFDPSTNEYVYKWEDPT